MTGVTHESALAEEIGRYVADTQPLGLFGNRAKTGGDGKPTAEAKSGAKAKFCAIWPEAREGLAALELLVPASIRIIISIVRSAGDAAAAGVCKAG